MTDTAWETLSQQAIAAAGVVYFLALLVHLVEWSALRQVPVEQAAKEPVGATVGGAGSVAVVAESPADPSETSTRSAFWTRLGVLLLGIAALVHAVGVVGRGMAADPNRVPWSNMYEFTISATFFIAVIYLATYRKLRLAWLGPWVSLFNLSLLMVAIIWLYSPVAQLRDALDSPWLTIHVISAIVATAAFTLGGMASILHLIKARSGDDTTGYLARVPSLRTLDVVAYRIHAFAFPVWTFAVLISGPIWAHQAWSAYWQWDPKEVWAFITWVMYAAYLHARTTAGWKGSRAAWLSLAGLATLWFSFIGVNYFISSQHSYAAPAIEMLLQR